MITLQWWRWLVSLGHLAAAFLLFMGSPPELLWLPCVFVSTAVLVHIDRWSFVRKSRSERADKIIQIAAKPLSFMTSPFPWLAVFAYQFFRMANWA